MASLFDQGDRRGFLRAGLDRWMKQLVEQTEERITLRRYYRPPGALPEVGFLAACTRCGKCEAVCPSDAIRLVPKSGGLAQGTPYLDPRLQPCTVCPDTPCIEACPTEALTLPERGWAETRLGAVTFVPERCVTFQGISCGVCAAACPVGEAALAIDEGGHPVLRREGCVGCGLCVRSCITAPSSFELSFVER
jgi:MauM/NapG family ferredoxin protein